MADDDAALVQALAWHAALRTGALDPATGSRSAETIPLVYLDKNPWGRDLDDLSVPRNAAEAGGMRRLVDMFRSGTIRLAYSSVSFGEGAPRDGSDSASRVALRAVIGLRLLGLPLVTHDERPDTSLVAKFLSGERGISGYDAIHAAAALLEGAWYFVTGDDRLRNHLNSLYDEWGLPVSAQTPDQVVSLIERGASLN